MNKKQLTSVLTLLIMTVCVPRSTVASENTWSNAVDLALGVPGGIGYDIVVRIAEICQQYNIGTNEIRQVVNECLQEKIDSTAQSPESIGRAMLLVRIYGNAETVQLLKQIVNKDASSHTALTSYMCCLNPQELREFMLTQVFVPDSRYNTNGRCDALFEIMNIHSAAPVESQQVIRELIDKVLTYEPHPYLFYLADRFILETDPTYTNSVKRAAILSARNIIAPPPPERAIWPTNAIVPNYPPPATTNTP